MTWRQSAVPRAKPNEHRVVEARGGGVGADDELGVEGALGEQRRDAQHRAAVGLAQPAEADQADADALARARRPGAGAADVAAALVTIRRLVEHAAELVLERVELGAAGHLLDELVAADLALAPVAHQPPAVEDHEAVADRDTRGAGCG